MRQNLLLAGLVLPPLLILLSHLAPRAAAEEVEPAPRRSLICRHFPVDLEDGSGGEFETADASGELGKWVSGYEAVGWRVASTDLEIGQKATGLMVAWTQVCLEREY